MNLVEIHAGDSSVGTEVLQSPLGPAETLLVLNYDFELGLTAPRYVRVLTGEFYFNSEM